MALPASAVELAHMRAYQGTLGEYYTGWATWECDQGDEEDLEKHLWQTAWTVGGHAMKASKITTMPRALPGRATLRVSYATLYNAATHPVGRASIVVETYETKKKQVVFRPDGGTTGMAEGQTAYTWIPKTILVPSEVDTEGIWWDLAPTTGPVKDTTYGTKVTVRTAYPRGAVNWNIILNAVGKYNANPLPYLGGAAKETMLLVGATVPAYYLLDDAYALVPINYVMLYDPSGWAWASVPKVQRYRKIVLGVPMVAADGLNADGSTKETGYLDEYGEGCTVEDAKKVPTVINKPLGAPVYCSKDQLAPDSITFAHLMGLLKWTR